MDSSPGGSAYLYREKQHFRQVWLWVLVLFVSLVSLYGTVEQLVLKRPFGDNPAPDGVMVVIALVFGVGFPLFMYLTNLTTEIRSDGLFVRFFPFHRSFIRIAAQEIKGFESCTYSPIGDYGGWGIRFGRKGKAYNVSGNRGVQLELSNGKHLLIGSQRPEELAKTLASIVRR